MVVFVQTTSLYYTFLAPLDAGLPRSRGFRAAVFGPAFTPGSPTTPLDFLLAPFTGLPGRLSQANGKPRERG